jgi:hypothetical protein
LAKDCNTYCSIGTSHCRLAVLSVTTNSGDFYIRNKCNGKGYAYIYGYLFKYTAMTKVVGVVYYDSCNSSDGNFLPQNMNGERRETNILKPVIHPNNI